MKCDFQKLGLVLALLGFGSLGFAQLQIPKPSQEIEFSSLLYSPSILLHPSDFSKSSFNTVGTLPQVYSVAELPVFCRVEVQIEKAVSFPVKFRLGSVEHVDWLEGKGDEAYLEKQ
ncbi:MAG: hypothetical protein KDC24_09390 [Saprospiraceae bacterium]|nr:hypothetical protein [Saprospiraceae bacterium]